MKRLYHSISARLGLICLATSLATLGLAAAAHYGLPPGSALRAPALLLTAIVAGLAGALLARFLSRPLRAIGHSASRMANGERVPVSLPDPPSGEIADVVTHFNRMLDVIEQRRLRLAESEEKFRLISESSRVGIFQLDPQRRCVYANEAMTRITGLSPEELHDREFSSLVHPDDRRQVQEQLQQLFTRGNEVQIECSLYRPGRQNRWISGHIAPLLTDDARHLGYLGSVADVTELKRAHNQLEHMAFYDTLTGLANRRLFRNRLEHLLSTLSRSGQGVALLLLDLDHFKDVNDSLGHDSGDTLLSVVAERLKQCVRYTDTVARLGGDEFAVILPNVGDTLVVSGIAEKILGALNRPVLLDATELNISTSIGIAVAPEDGASAEALIKNADLALYRAKDLGRNNFTFFTQEMNTALVDHLRLVQDLRRATETETLHLEFQPQVQLASGQLVGFEALARWHHPQRGNVPPTRFIPVAEDTDLIIPMGRWILQKACTELQRLLRLRLLSPRALVTVNLSIRQLRDEQLPAFIRSTLERCELHPSQLELEVTETVLMEELDDNIAALRAIKELGVSLSIDDFGTGYSSLGYLKRLPINVIKVDRSFVADIPDDRDDMEITAAVIAMAHKLRYKVVAEGIETRAQFDFLRMSGCDFGQGYLISPPLNSTQLEDFCRHYQAELETRLSQPEGRNVTATQEQYDGGSTAPGVDSRSGP